MNFKGIVSLVILALTGGSISGFLGIGGAAFYNPFFIMYDINPQVASATGMYIVLIGSISNAVFWIGQGDFYVGYEPVTIVIDGSCEEASPKAVGWKESVGVKVNKI